MRKKRLKLGIIILLYAVIINGVLIYGFISYRNNLKNEAIRLDYSVNYYLPDKDSSHNELAQNLEGERFKALRTFYDSFYKKIEQMQISFTILLIVFLIESTVLLWWILRHLNKKETSHIASHFQSIEWDDSVGPFENSELNEAYAYICGVYQKQLEDYKRLHTYLSHEQKNALAALRVSLEVGGAEDYLKQMDYLNNSINDVLTLSENGDYSVLCAVEVAEVCAELYDTYRKSYPNMTFEFDPQSNTEIYAKERWIYRAVSNLVDNAIKYGNEKRISISVVNKNHSVIIMVQDHGNGIDRTQQDKIFSYQYRISELNKNGYGIGLSVVNHVCDMCCGCAYLESTPGLGSTFYLSFPEYLE